MPVPVPCGLSRESSAPLLQRVWFRNPPGSWKSVRYECCLLSGRVFCVGPITHPEESYRLRCGFVFYLENLVIEVMLDDGGSWARNYYIIYCDNYIILFKQSTIFNINQNTTCFLFRLYHYE